MSDKLLLQDWLLEALEALGGSAPLIDICKTVWRLHANDLEKSEDLFFSWQYDIRWAATALRERGVLRDAKNSPRGVWELKSVPAKL